MIFISYSREDRAETRRCEQAMAEAGLPFLRDLTLVEGDPFWRDKIAHCLEQCQVMVILWSEYARTSPWVEQEMRAFQGPKLLVPLDHSPEVTEGFDPNQTFIVSRRDLIAKIKHFWPARARRSVSEQVPETRSTEIQVATKRKDQIANQQVRLSEFAKHLLDYQIKEVEIQGEFIHNKIDGSWLKQISLKNSVSEAKNSAIYVGLEPVTNTQYRKFIKKTGFPPPPTWGRKGFIRPDAPIVGINWFEASAYALWVGGSLPTEEEWESAARGHFKNATYATQTGQIDPDVAYYARQLATGAPVSNKEFPAGQAGFYGMCGNTWDWCDSKWGTHCVIRGGGYMDSAHFCRIQARYRNAPIDRDCCVGFRIKMELP